MIRPLVADHLLFPEVLWQLPQNLYQKRGKILLVGGSPGHIKPLIEMAEVCLAMSTREVTLALPESLAAALPGLPPELSIVSLPETPTASLARSSLSSLIEQSTQTDLTVLGLALSRQSETQQLMREVVPKLGSATIIVDDGVEAISAKELTANQRPKLLIVDAGSLVRFGKRSGENTTIEQLYKGSTSIAADLAQRWHLSLLLTSPEPLVANEQGQVVTAPKIPSDVISQHIPLLSGTIASLAASQTEKLFECTATALTIFGTLRKQGFLELHKKGQLLAVLPKTMAELERTASSGPDQASDQASEPKR